MSAGFFIGAALLLAACQSSFQGASHGSDHPVPPGPARNIILFVSDAAGIPTVNAASLLAYDAPMRLHVQQWPHLGLSDTSPVGEWVSDSANGMTSIVTGIKTRNGVISQGPDAQRGRRDGTFSKTVLEYAEERGLATGVVTNMPITDATPAACYAHSNDRARWGEIFQQAFSPRFGDGVDVLIGAGREEIGKQLQQLGTHFEDLARQHSRPIHSGLEELPANQSRPVVVSDRIDVRAATHTALDLLEQSDNGYFLVVEWDAHTDDVKAGLQNVVDLDRLVAEVERRVDLDDTLLIFTADHSFGLQVDGGKPGEPLLAGYDDWKLAGAGDKLVRLRNVLVNRTHTAEEVVVLAKGPGASKVRGYFSNTYLFDVMLEAWGWQAGRSQH